MTRHFIGSWKKVRFKKQYILYAVMYGLSTLVIPFTTQYLVNQLSLSAIFVNTLTFLFVLGFLLAVSQVFKYCQVIFIEYIQREIFMIEGSRWKLPTDPAKSHYFIEVTNQLKFFSMAFSHLVELTLLLFFGLLVVITFHPAFLVLLAILSVSIFLISRSWDEAIRTSVMESDEKYHIVDKKKDGKEINDDDLFSYLEKRNLHFYFIKRNKIITGSTFLISHIFLLGMGLYLIQLDQLSIGQFVASEIILSGILASLTVLPKTMEHLYDYETSKIKLDYALKGKLNE